MTGGRLPGALRYRAPAPAADNEQNQCHHGNPYPHNQQDDPGRANVEPRRCDLDSEAQDRTDDSEHDAEYQQSHAARC